MVQTTPSKSKFKVGILGAAAGAAMVGTVVAGTSLFDPRPAFADAVSVVGVQAPSFANVVEKVKPAVVSVQVKSAVAPVSKQDGMFDIPGFENLPDGHPLRRFFKEFGGKDGAKGNNGKNGNEKSRLRPTSQGSGFFVSEDGYIVTNNHVVEKGAEFTVVMDDGTKLDAKLVGTDPRTDLALLKVDDKRKFIYVEFADDSKVRVGDWVVAVGNPFGLGGSVTAGIVSARGRDIGAGAYDDFIQIDAAVNRGNSGGPAFNLEGKVIGVNTAIFSPSGGNVGIAFAIPASLATEVISDLKEDGSIERGWLGVRIQPVTEDIAESVGLPKAEGAMVTEPQSDGPALAAGIKAGDIITAVNDQAIKSDRDLARKIAALDPKEKVTVHIWRDGKAEQVEVTLGLFPTAKVKPSEKAGNSDEQVTTTLNEFGLTITPADGGKGVVVTNIEPGSIAEERGIQPGDTIMAVNSNEISSADAIEKLVSEATTAGRKAILLQIQRNGNNLFVALPIDQG